VRAPADRAARRRGDHPERAVTAGLHAEIQALLPVPVIDAASCAVQLAESLVRLKPFKPMAGSFSAPEGRRVSGVDPAIARLFESKT